MKNNGNLFVEINKAYLKEIVKKTGMTHVKFSNAIGQVDKFILH